VLQCTYPEGCHRVRVYASLMRVCMCVSVCLCH
jgi:hypothetical protein